MSTGLKNESENTVHESTKFFHKPTFLGVANTCCVAGAFLQERVVEEFYESLYSLDNTGLKNRSNAVVGEIRALIFHSSYLSNMLADTNKHSLMLLAFVLQQA